MARVGWAVLLVLAARTAGAAELRELLAVLEIAVEDAAVPDSAAALLTDQLRSASRKVAGERLKIMTRENMTELLPPGTNQRCFMGACLAQIGVMLQARYVMGGTVRKVGSRLTLTVEAYDSNSKNLLGSEVLLQKNVDELVDAIVRDAPGYVRAWIPGLGGATVAAAPPVPVETGPSAPPPPDAATSGPRINRGQRTKAVGNLTIAATPAELARLEVVDPSGRKQDGGSPYTNAQATPGKWKATASAAGYQSQSEEFDVPADLATAKNYVLQALGRLEIVATPAGKVRLEVTPPKGRSAAYGSPYTLAQAEPGRWRVQASAGGYEAQARDVDVPLAKPTRVAIDLKPLGGLSVTGTPAGAAVTVTGPGGFTDDGALPWEGSGLASGSYRVKATRTGYRDFDESVEVEPGRTAEVKMTLQRVEAAVVATYSGGGGGRVEPRSGLEFVSLPGGRFHYGCEPNDSECDGDEKPGREATVGAFSLGKTEVTVDAYARCVRSGACTEASTQYSECNWGKSDRGNQPINCVDWNQAKAFCEWIGGRLPTAEEWEYAAKSGGGRICPWGNERASCRRAIMDDGGKGCGKGSTWPVCSNPSGNSTAGICDLAGNVWEWTASKYDANTQELRGGGWDCSPWGLRASARGRNRPAEWDISLGLRCALSR